MEYFLKNKFKYIKLTIVIGFCFIIAEAILILFYSQLHIDQFWISICSVFGVVCLFIGGLKYFLFKNEGYAKSYKINESDERNTLVREHSAYLAFMFSNVTLAILTVVFSSLGMSLGFKITGILLAIQYAVYFILTKYYDKKL